MNQIKKSIRIPVAVCIFAMAILVLPSSVKAADPIDPYPNQQLLKSFLPGTVLNLNNFPVYILNLTPYKIVRNTADIHDWWMPREIAPGDLGVGFINKWFITNAYLPSSPKPLDRHYNFSIVDSVKANDAGNTEFVIHILRDADINPDWKETEYARSGIYDEILLWDKIVGTILENVSPEGVKSFVKAGKTGISAIVNLIKKIDESKMQDCGFYIYGYATARAAICVPGSTYFLDYCNDPILAKKYCKGVQAYSSFDSVWNNTGNTCRKDITSPLDPTVKYAFGNMTFSGAPFKNENDPNQGYPGYQGPYFVLTVYILNDVHAGLQQIQAERLQKSGLGNREPKLQALFDSILKNDLKIQSALMQKIGPEKAGEITKFMQNLKPDLTTGLSKEQSDQVDKFLSWMK